MKIYRILISAQTSSFRYPNFISSNQLSLKSVPYSTIAGLVACATGNDALIDFRFSYVFRYISNYVDLETIYKFKVKKGQVKNKPVIEDPTFRREVLFGCYLTLYLDNKEIANSFKSPIFQLLLGRSGDLASVLEVKEIEVSARDEILINGTIFPFDGNLIPGEIYAMPSYFKYDELIRVTQNVRPFLVSDGVGRFIEKPKTKLDKFNLNNWRFRQQESKIKLDSFFDDELNTPIFLRSLC